MTMKGFSLVESAVSLALIGLLASFSANVVGHMSRTDAQSVQFNESMMLAAQIADTLKDPATCENNFVGLNPSTNPTLTSVVDFGGAPIVSVGPIIVPANIRVSNLRIANYYALGAGGAGVAEFEIIVDQIYNGQVMHQRSIPIFFETIVNPANQITRCQLVGGGGVNEAFCNAVGGTMATGVCSAINATGSFGVANSITVTGTVTALNNFNTTNLTVNGPLSAPSATAATFDYSGPSVVNGNVNLSGTGRFHGITSLGNICIGGVCRNFNATGCAIGQYGYGVNPNGTIKCLPIPPPPPPPPPPPLPP